MILISNLLLFQFVVVKFINEDDMCDDEDDALFEVGLTKWLGDIDDKIKTNISWPPRSIQSVALKKEMNASLLWPEYNVVVLRFYSTLVCLVHIHFYIFS